MRRGATVAAALLAVCIVAWLLALRSEPASKAAPGNEAMQPSSGPVPATPSNASRAPTAAEGEEWKPGDLPAVAARRFAEAPDKRAFYDRALKVGGGAWLMQAGTALEECSIVSAYGMVGAEQAIAARGLDARRMAAFKEQIRGCEGFETRRVEAAERVALAKRLREQGDLASRAYALQPGAVITPAQQTGAQLLALEALSTGDAYLVSELAQYFAFRQTGLLGSPRIASSADPRIEAMQSERDAWTWAACELGMDCGPGSINGRRVCIEMAKCDWKSFDEIAGDVFAASGKPVPRARKDEIVAALRAKDWSKLGF
jgi:hypothetical protein